MRQLVPQTQLINYEHIAATAAWHSRITDLLVLTEEGAMYPPTDTTLYDAFWRTLCCNRSSIDLDLPPSSDASYLAWLRLLDILQHQSTIDASYRRANRVQKRWFWVLYPLATAGLTYRLRHNKLVAMAITMSVPLAIRWFNKTWDLGLRILLHDLYSASQPHSNPAQIAARDFEASFSEWTQGRQFAITHGGLMGWVPLAARVGDQVGLFAGCRIPYVLRKREARGHGIVGDAYLHGAMNGEGEGWEGEMIEIV
jgi:hypothetical protein